MPGPPVQFGPPVEPETVKSGEGFTGTGMPENDIFYFHPDHLGSTSYITNKNGSISQHVEYIAFGEVLFEEHSSSFSSPYLFNGKELDRETNLSYYGARYYDAKTSLWLNVDPLAEKMPSYGAYVFSFNNPIRFVDPDGRLAGDFYDENGNHIGNDGVKDNKVYITDQKTIDSNTKDKKTNWSAVKDSKSTTDLTQKYKISHSDFLNRANWVYGEGGGNFTDYYAHTMKNLKEHGVWGPANKPFKSDEAMFKTKMTHKVGKVIKNMYPGYFDGTDGNVNSKAFANLRNDLDQLTSNEDMRNSIKSVIGSIMGTTTDPTGGAYQWVGGPGANGPLARNPTLNNATNVTNKTSGKGKGQRYHTFYELLKE